VLYQCLHSPCQFYDMLPPLVRNRKINTKYSYQIIEQGKRLRKVEQIERVKNSFVDFKSSMTRSSEAKEPLLRNTLSDPDKVYIETRGGFCYNLRQIFTYSPSSQEDLKLFLCSDSDRLSTFLNKEDKKFAREG